MVGRIVSIKMDHSAVMIVEGKKTHRKYKKSFVYTKKYIVDDPFEVKLGDVVIVEKIAPMSKRKHWRITKVLGKDIVSIEQAELLEDANEAIAEVMPEESHSAEATRDVKEEVKVEVAEESNFAKASLDKKPKKVTKTQAAKASDAKKKKEAKA